MSSCFDSIGLSGFAFALFSFLFGAFCKVFFTWFNTLIIDFLKHVDRFFFLLRFIFLWDSNLQRWHWWLFDLSRFIHHLHNFWCVLPTHVLQLLLATTRTSEAVETFTILKFGVFGSGSIYSRGSWYPKLFMLIMHEIKLLNLMIIVLNLWWRIALGSRMALWN